MPACAAASMAAPVVAAWLVTLPTLTKIGAARARAEREGVGGVAPWPRTKRAVATPAPTRHHHREAPSANHFRGIEGRC